MSTRGLPPLFGLPWERQKEPIQMPYTPRAQSVGSGGYMRVVVAAVPFGRLDSIPIRSRLEDALVQAGIAYELAQTALLLDPVAQARSFLRRRPPYLYFLVDSEAAEPAKRAVRAVAPETLPGAKRLGHPGGEKSGWVG